jgi:taurine--2-oxoglutarate transaminase
MTGEEIVALSKKHTITEYAAQDAVNPIPVRQGQGCLLLDPGREALHRLQQPADVGEHRPRRPAGDCRHHRTGAEGHLRHAVDDHRGAGAAGAKLAEITPGDIDAFFFTNGGAEANENAFKIARAVTGAQKILARYRSYHGGTGRAIAGHRRPARLEPAAAAGLRARARPVSRRGARLGRRATALRNLEEVIQLEGPAHHRAFILRP